MKTLASTRDRAEILARLSRIRPDSPRRWGTMHAHQMVCHLSDAFRMVTGEKAVRPATTVLRRTVVRWVALYAPLPWPPNIVTLPELDQGIGGTCPGDFAADMADLRGLVEHLTSDPGRITQPEHPIFGRLTERAWYRWAYLHIDHHLRQFGA